MKKLLITACVCLLPLGLIAADAVEGEESVSALTNPAQAQKAENVAQASLEASLEQDPAVMEAKAALDAAQTEEDKAAAQAALDAAVANVTGVSKDDIEGMRASGMGWGEIAHELGVHPSVLGLGHTKQMEKTERERNTKGFSKESTTASNGGGKALGLAGKADKSNNGKSGNAGGNNGKSGGNNGNGNGNGGGKK